MRGSPRQFTDVSHPVLGAEISFGEVISFINMSKAGKAPDPLQIPNDLYIASPINWLFMLENIFQ